MISASSSFGQRQFEAYIGTTTADRIDKLRAGSGASLTEVLRRSMAMTKLFTQASAGAFTQEHTADSASDAIVGFLRNPNLNGMVMERDADRPFPVNIRVNEEFYAFVQSIMQGQLVSKDDLLECSVFIYTTLHDSVGDGQA